MQTQLVLFDFDGTLVDTAPDIIRAVNLFVEREGFDPLPEPLIRNHIGHGIRKLLHGVYPDHELDDNQRRRIEGDFLKVYEREMLVSPTLNPGAEEFLFTFDGQCGILSNKRHRHLIAILEKLNIQPLPWSCIIGGDTYNNMKPHPEPFLAAMQRAGVTPEETVIVGDGLPDIMGAVTVGCRAIAVDFGYHPAEELLELGALGPISSFSDLFSFL